MGILQEAIRRKKILLEQAKIEKNKEMIQMYEEHILYLEKKIKEKYESIM